MPYEDPQIVQEWLDALIELDVSLMHYSMLKTFANKYRTTPTKSSRNTAKMGVLLSLYYQPGN